MIRISACVVLATLLWAAPAAAIEFRLTPIDGAVEAAPGMSIGWGYEIFNDHPLYWLEIYALDAGTFAYGTVTDPLNIFTFPILAPGETVGAPYVPGGPGVASGLYEFTWAVDAPLDAINTGTFVLSAFLWNADPFSGMGEIVGDLQLSAAYSVAVTPPAGVPEPGTLLLLSTGIGLAGLARRSRRRRVTE